MIRRTALAACMLVLLGASTAPAQEAAVDIQQFKPVTDVDGFVLVHDASLLPQFRFGVGFDLNYAVNPLEVRAVGFGRQFGLYDGLIGGDLYGAFSVFDFFDVGLRFPIMQIPVTTDFVSSPSWPGAKVPYGIGDILIESRIRILDPAEKAVGVAINPWLTLPTGTARAGLGRGLPGTGIKGIVSQRWSRLHFAVNAGFAFFGRSTIANLTTGNEFTYGLAVGVSPVVDHLEVNVELEGSLIADGNDRDDKERFFDQAHSPVEVLLSARGTLNNGLTFHGGVSKGLSGGYGTPDVRFFAGVGWAIRTPRDRDKDGLHDKIDGCPTEPEDVDEFEDEDGCPDPDNDGDGVTDDVDACRDVAEDKDGFEDGDGCPDPDNDGDGILDVDDSCPIEAEDADGFEDEDGCIDPDNDGDGLLDTLDTCPDAAEDVDGWKDEDGCPDADNDGDGLLDAVDLCPNEPEDINGIKDEDGCPDSTLAVKTADSIVILEKVFFATGKDRVLKKSAPVLDAVAKVLDENPSVLRVRVEGHTDDVGRDESNLDLSQRRAESVMRELVKRGVDGERLEAVGYGETRPIDTNRTADGRERNRRVEFNIVETDQPAAPEPAPTAPPAGNPWGAPAPAEPTPTPAPATEPAAEPASAESPWGAPAATESAAPAQEPAAEEPAAEEPAAEPADDGALSPADIWGVSGSTEDLVEEDEKDDETQKAEPAGSPWGQ